MYTTSCRPCAACTALVVLVGSHLHDPANKTFARKIAYLSSRQRPHVEDNRSDSAIWFCRHSSSGLSGGRKGRWQLKIGRLQGGGQKSCFLQRRQCICIARYEAELCSVSAPIWLRESWITLAVYDVYFAKVAGAPLPWSRPDPALVLGAVV